VGVCNYRTGEWQWLGGSGCFSRKDAPTPKLSNGVNLVAIGGELMELWPLWQKLDFFFFFFIFLKMK
jgi:hypothetical protein